MAQKIYEPTQFFLHGGKVEVYNLKRVRQETITDFSKMLSNLNNQKWRAEHYMRSFIKGKEYTLVFNVDDRQTYLFVESSYYLRTKAKAEREDAERNSN